MMVPGTDTTITPKGETDDHVWRLGTGLSSSRVPSGSARVSPDHSGAVGWQGVPGEERRRGPRRRWTGSAAPWHHGAMDVIHCQVPVPAALYGPGKPPVCRLPGREHQGDHKAHVTIRGVGRITYRWKESRRQPVEVDLPVPEWHSKVQTQVHGS